MKGSLYKMAFLWIMINYYIYGGVNVNNMFSVSDEFPILGGRSDAASKLGRGAALQRLLVLDQQLLWGHKIR